MERNDWREAGDQIKRLVQDAVESGDFSQLGNTISGVVNDTVEGLQSVLQESLDSLQGRGSSKNAQQNRERRRADENGMSGSGQPPYDEQWNGRYASGSRYRERTNSEAARRIRENMRQRRQMPEKSRDRAASPVKAKLRVPGEIGGRLLKYYGYSMSSMFGIAFVILGIVTVTSGVNLSMALGIFAFLFGIHFVIGQKGKDQLELVQRFRRYQAIIGERTYCLLEELASGTGESSKFVKKDLRRMIGRGYFKEGYLDQKGTLLITDKSTYQQYLASQTEFAKRRTDEELWGAEKEKEKEKKKKEKKKEKKAKAGGRAGETERRPETENGDTAKNAEGAAEERLSGSKLSGEYQELLEEGRNYILHIRACNERIPDETMSSRLDRLELVVTRIFTEAEKNPAVVPDLKKMMSYYLPTTRKLLDAYCEMDAQPIRGQNIESTKKEIEKAMDTLNQAFEKLLDDLFEETAWDISSDISVLQTMLAQEGLTGTDFDVKPGKQGGAE